MKKCLSASLVTLLTVFSVSAAVEPLAVLRVPSVEKLGSATTQLCGAIGQPMLGGMASGMLQQYIQTSIGPFDQTKPVAIVAYADTAKLEASLSKGGDESNPIPMEGLSEVKAGLILPITMSGEEFARSKLLKLNAEGVAQLPGTPMFITFKGQNAFIASDSQTAQRLKIEAAHYQAAPANGDALSIEFFPPAIALYGNIIANQNKVKKADLGPMQTTLMALSASSAEETKKQLAQFASFTLGLGFNQTKGLAIGWDTRYKPGTELATLAAVTKPVNADLLASVPDSAQFCQLLSLKTPEMVTQQKKLPELVQILQTLLGEAIGKKYPALAKAFEESLSETVKITEKSEQDLAAFGYDKTSRFWLYSRVITLPGQKDAVFQSLLDGNRKLASAMETSFPGKQFLTFDASSATLTLDLAKLPIKEIAEVCKKDGKKIEEKDLAELEKNIQSVHQVLTGGKPFRKRFEKTEDGYKIIAFSDGVANLPKCTGNGKMAAQAAKLSNVTAHFCRFDLFTFARNALNELATKLPEKNQKKLTSMLALLPAGVPESGLSVCREIRGATSRCEVILPPGDLQQLSGIITAVSQGDDDDDDNQ